ncbi:MAG: hypothetical protein JWL59_4870 [Chthoniobacteraceae bacterium]|nr:hypothetical protein [Chthoniobacteraceae bacterium]
MEIALESRRKSEATLQKYYPNACVIDVTSKGEQPWVKFSPFFPHGGIPVPFSSDMTATSVEGIWQALKVFETTDVDSSKLQITNMVGLKRTVRRNGRILGHRAGLNGTTLLSYRDARLQIYLPSYRWVLDHCLQAEVRELKNLAASREVVLLDFETNCDVDDISRPLSHAGLVAAYLAGTWPSDSATRPTQ